MIPEPASQESQENVEGVAIVGIGVMAPPAPGRTRFWELITSGRSATRAITHFDAADYRSRMAGEVDIKFADHGLSGHRYDSLDRGILLLLAAGREACEDAGLAAAGIDPAALGVAVGTAVGPTIQLIDFYQRVSDEGRQWEIDPGSGMASGVYDGMVPSTFAAELAAEFGARGPVATFSSGCTSGIDAVARGASMILRGDADVVLAGGADAPICPISVACFDAIKATSADNDAPHAACKPFDSRRDGFVLAEGAAVLVLERASRAAARGADVYAVIRGFGATSNSFHMTGLAPAGEELARAIADALRTLPEGAAGIDYINAHGSGTKQNDRHETAAFKLALGEHARNVSISSIKSMIGHSLGAIGAIEIAACALAIRHGVVPPTANLEQPDELCDLDYVPLTARRQRLAGALSTASGFGGFQSAMVLTAGPRDETEGRS